MRALTTGTVTLLLGLAAISALANPKQAPSFDAAMDPSSVTQAADATVFEMVSRKYREWAQENAVLSVSQSK